VKLPDALLFASDAELAALSGAACLLLGIGCLLMERRRVRRAAIDRVGWVPWTGLFLMLAVTVGGLIALGLPAWIRGS
jgi:phosphotransferase system  glucose/maltose/N-acetylglucosamine-specific IIC component